MGSWATLARFVGADVAISAVANHFEPEMPDTLSVEQCISKGVFGSEGNVFEDFRREVATIPAKENTLVATANEQLKNKIPVVSSDFTEWMQAGNGGLSWVGGYGEEQRKRAERYKDVPLVVVPGQEEAYLQDMARKNESATVVPEQAQPETEQRERVEKEMRESVVSAAKETRKEQTAQSNTNGWGGLLGSLGLNGMGDTIGKLGYVMAMLPDVLLGAFTGKSPSLRFEDNLLR